MPIRTVRKLRASRENSSSEKRRRLKTGKRAGLSSSGKLRKKRQAVRRDPRPGRQKVAAGRRNSSPAEGDGKTAQRSEKLPKIRKRSQRK